MNKIITILEQNRVRRYIYRTATAILLLIAGYGLIEGDQIALWMGVFAAVTSMADVKTDVPPGKHRE